MLTGRALAAARAPSSAQCIRSTRMSAQASATNHISQPAYQRHKKPRPWGTLPVSVQTERRSIDCNNQQSASAAAPADGKQQAHPSVRRRPSQGELVERAVQAVAARHPLIDIGVNLMDASFNKDRAAVVERAQLAGCEASIITGSCVRTATAAARFCGQPSLHPLYFTAGVHPHNAKHCGPSTLGELEQLAAHPACVAIGECGLDFNRNFSPPDVQEHWFGQQVALAERLGMPLFVHCREAYPQLAAVLRQHHRSVPVVVHCFTGGKDDLALMLGMGFSIGITGWVCDERPDRGAAELAALLPLIPDDRLMIETDAPYLTPRTIQPSKQRPQRNEPALLPYVLERVAAARGQRPEHVAWITTQNARTFFHLNHGGS